MSGVGRSAKRRSTPPTRISPHARKPSICADEHASPLETARHLLQLLRRKQEAASRDLSDPTTYYRKMVEEGSGGLPCATASSPKPELVGATVLVGLALASKPQIFRAILDGSPVVSLEVPDDGVEPVSECIRICFGPRKIRDGRPKRVVSVNEVEIRGGVGAAIGQAA